MAKVDLNLHVTWACDHSCDHTVANTKIQLIGSSQHIEVMFYLNCIETHILGFRVGIPEQGRVHVTVIFFITFLASL